MSFDRCRIQRQSYGIFTELGQGLEDRLPASALGLSIEPIGDRRARTVFVRAIAPTATRLQHMDNAADNPSVVVAFRPGQSAAKIRPEPGPLTIVQPEQARSHARIASSRITSDKENH